MKQHQNHLKFARCTERIFALGTVLALAIAPAIAFAGIEEGGRDKPPGAGPFAPTLASGDEFIGTLPVMSNGGQIELHRGLPILRPSLFIEGDLWQVVNSISILEGTVVANVEPLDADWTRVRLVFPDQVLLGFDRLAVQGSDLQFGLWMPQPVFYAYPQLSWGTRSVALNPTDARLALPIAEMSTAGALHGSPLVVRSAGFLGPNALMAASNQDFLFLAQRH